MIEKKQLLEVAKEVNEVTGKFDINDLKTILMDGSVYNEPVPHLCPVCNGNGLVPGGFYTQTSGNWMSTNATEECRSCNGTGVIWSTVPIE